jgi:CHAT domain-containing protein
MTAPGSMTLCPSEETLASFIDCRLDREARRRVIEHMSVCGDCRGVVVTASEFKAGHGYITPEPQPISQWTRRATRLAAAAVVVIMLGTMVRQRLFAPKSDVRTLVSASETLRFRPVDGRISGGFPYKPVRQGTRSEKDSAGGTRNLRLQAVAAELEATASRSRTPENLRALAAAHLLLGNVDSSIEALEATLTEKSGTADVRTAIGRSVDASTLSDLSAVYIARGRRADTATDFFMAVEAAERAWSLARTEETAWNRAVALESLSLRNRAVGAWKAYLALDAHSAWASEARERLRRLNEPSQSDRWSKALPELDDPEVMLSEEGARYLAERFAQRLRTHAEDQLFPRWGMLYRRGDSGAAEQVRARLRLIGVALASSGERAIADIAGAIDAATEANDQERLARLAQACVDYGAGQEAYNKKNIREAAPLFERAARAFTAAESPFRFQARLQGAICVYFGNRYDESVALLEELRGDLGPSIDRYRALAARIDAVQGLAKDHTGRTDEALLLYKRALAQFERQHEEENELHLHTLIADFLNRQGERTQTFRHHARALELLVATGNRSRRHIAMFEAAFAALQHRYVTVAELILDDLAEFDVRQKEPSSTCTTFMWRAVLRAKRGESQLASRDFDEAQHHCSSVQDENIRRRGLANLALAYASAGPEFSQRATLDSLSDAIEFFSGSDNHMWLPQLLAERGRAYRLLGDSRHAREDLAKGIKELEYLERRSPQTGDEWLLTDASDTLFESMVALLIDEGKLGDALLYADRAADRKQSGQYAAAQGVRSELDDRAPATIQLGDLRKALGENVIAVEFMLASDRLSTFVVMSGRIAVHSRQVDSKNVVRQLSSFTAAIREGTASDAPDDAQRVTSLLLAPWIHLVPRNATIVFAMGSGLQPIPLAALRDPRDGRFLIESHAVVSNSSLRRFAAAVAADKGRAHDTIPTTLLIAAAEGFAGDGFEPPREALRYAEREFSQLEGTPGMVVLRGHNATRSRFLEHGASAVVIHFAGHGHADAQMPLQSALLFNRLDRDSGLLRLADLPPSSLPLARLLILSACSTGYETHPDVSFASAFQMQGVPSVVATLWDVDDRAAASIGSILHRELRRGTSRAAALREAQLALLHDPDPELRAPSAWAGYFLTGAIDSLMKEVKVDG